MIIKGGSRGEGAALGIYLQNMEANERATVLEVKGTVATDIVGALKEMEAYADGTKCEKPLYHLIISPQPGYRLTADQLMESVELVTKALGLGDQPRVVVAHEKLGREHFHVAVARIDLQTLTAIPDGHNFAKHEEVARELERRFGHPHVQGAHAERENVERPDRSPTRGELRQEQLTGIKSKDIREEVTALFRASENAEAFKAALEDAGYILAKGDRRDFVLIDRAGGEHSLARRISGMKAAPLREFMAGIDRDGLPTVEEAKGIVLDRLSAGSEFDRQCWENALATAAAEKTHADDDELKRHRKEARDNSRIEAAYARGDDFASQTRAAQTDYERRQNALNAEPRPSRPSERSEDEERIARILDEGDRDRRHAEQDMAERGSGKRGDDIADNFANTEMTEAQQQRIERMLDNDGGRDHSIDRPPDRQREAPGGGRTRSR